MISLQPYQPLQFLLFTVVPFQLNNHLVLCIISLKISENSHVREMHSLNLEQYIMCMLLYYAPFVLLQWYPPNSIANCNDCSVFHLERQAYLADT